MSIYYYKYYCFEFLSLNLLDNQYKTLFILKVLKVTLTSKVNLQLNFGNIHLLVYNEQLHFIKFFVLHNFH